MREIRIANNCENCCHCDIKQKVSTDSLKNIQVDTMYYCILDNPVILVNAFNICDYWEKQ
jgi:hypothetical protein